MERQCAWCLRLMDRFGEPTSTPVPKRYEVSHGMCRICGSHWLEQAVKDTEKQIADEKYRLLLVNEIEKGEI